MCKIFKKLAQIHNKFLKGLKKFLPQYWFRFWTEFQLSVSNQHSSFDPLVVIFKKSCIQMIFLQVFLLSTIALPINGRFADFYQLNGKSATKSPLFYLCWQITPFNRASLPWNWDGDSNGQIILVVMRIRNAELEKIWNR